MICKPDIPYINLIYELGLEKNLKSSFTKMGYFIHNRLYPWGSPVELLRFPLLNIIDKFPYALHIIYSKNLKEWKRLDKITAHEWLIKWLGEKGYKILWEQAIDLKFGDYSKDISAAWL